MALIYTRYPAIEAIIPGGGISGMSDEDLNELVTYWLNDRNMVNDALERATAEQAKRGLR